jgi:hypothetical protein
MYGLPTVLIASLVTVVALAADPAPTTLQLGKADLGKLPKGWKAEKTGKGEGSVWKVVADETAPSKSGLVLMQTAEGPTSLFNLCVAEGSRFRDGEVSVRFKSVKGGIDQGGGVAWRYQDANNYYVCRYNPLEQNFRAYKVIDGKRSQLASQADVSVPDGAWATLSITHRGARIECFLDGKKYLEATDSDIAKEGKVALWTKADAQTAFDEWKVTPAKAK